MIGQYNKGMYCSRIITGLVLSITFYAATVCASESMLDSRLAIPDAVKEAFYNGLSLPITIKTTANSNVKQNSQEQNITIGVANIALKNNKFILQAITVDGGQIPHKVVLSNTAKSQLMMAKGKELSNNGWLVVSPDIKLHLEPLTMHLELVVERSFFGITSQHRDSVLPVSVVRDFTSLLDYDLNAYTSSYQGVSSQSSNLTFQSQSAIGEHHLDIEGTAINGDESLYSLNKAMYEHDSNGYRFAAGMIDSWSMQSISNVSTLGNGKIYGLSYGNASRSLKVDDSQSLTPIIVYFPSAGEARIFRNERLLSVQRVAMGNQQLDTEHLPSGVYDVRVDVVIGGQVSSSRIFHVNKVRGNNKYGDSMGWQFWGGVLENGTNNFSLDGQQDDALTPIGGVSLTSYWHDINWNMSLYQTGDVSVEEGLATWQLSDVLRFDLQNLYSSDSSNQWSVRGSYDLPSSLGAAWFYRQRGSNGNKLPFYAQSYDSAGMSLNISNWINSAGTLNISYEKESENNTQYVRADYNQMIYSGRFGSAQLQLGMTGSDFSGADQQYYASINFSLPLNADFQIGLSQQGAQRELDLQIGKSFENSFITYAGANTSTVMYAGEQSSNYSAYADYSGRYGQGSLSYNGSQGSSSISVSNHGAFALTNTGLASGNGTGDAALVVDMPDIKTGDLEVVLNEQVYPLASGRNLISLPAYDSYRLNVRSSELADSSYQIADNDQPLLTLYPGNVAEINPDIKQMVTVFGQLVDGKGTPLRYARINNHIGITTSDENGNFAVDVDKHHPQVIVQLRDEQKFEVVMNLNHDDATKWLGQVQWSGGDIYLGG